MPWPLMSGNVSREDLDAVIGFLSQDDPRLTQGEQVEAFEREFAQWLGARYAVMVNSGSSANLITLAALKATGRRGAVIVPSLTWSSDIASVLHAGFEPLFVDIDPATMGMDWSQVFRLIEQGPVAAVFPTHVLGFDALTDEALVRLNALGIPVFEDCCEATGARHEGRRLGTFGLASNFSFYYAHHMSTVEGGMVCTDDENFYETCRMLRSHGLTREVRSQTLRRMIEQDEPTYPEFTFALAGYNVRSTEIAAVIGRRQLQRLDRNNAVRSYNLATFLTGLDPARYRTGYRSEGSCNYALPLVLTRPDDVLFEAVTEFLDAERVEYRRGTAGGGNQLRQPYLRNRDDPTRYPEVEHVHRYGLYIGNWPGLAHGTIVALCDKLNAL